MESFDGLAVLATNLRANLDDAFTRRLDLVIDFPVPDPDQRLALWHLCLAPLLPGAGDLDLPFCAHSFELAGGNIRAIAVTAAYRRPSSSARGQLRRRARRPRGPCGAGGRLLTSRSFARRRRR